MISFEVAKVPHLTLEVNSIVQVFLLLSLLKSLIVIVFKNKLKLKEVNSIHDEKLRLSDVFHYSYYNLINVTYLFFQVSIGRKKSASIRLTFFKSNTIKKY